MQETVLKIPHIFVLKSAERGQNETKWGNPVYKVRESFDFCARIVQVTTKNHKDE